MWPAASPSPCAPFCTSRPGSGSSSEGSPRPSPHQYSLDPCPSLLWGIIALERSCKAGAGLSILIQHLKIGSPTRFGAGEQAPGGLPQGRSLKALGGHPPRFTNVGQCRGLARPSGALLFPGSPPLHQVEPGAQ